MMIMMYVLWQGIRKISEVCSEVCWHQWSLTNNFDVMCWIRADVWKADFLMELWLKGWFFWNAELWLIFERLNCVDMMLVESLENVSMNVANLNLILIEMKAHNSQNTYKYTIHACIRYPLFFNLSPYTPISNSIYYFRIVTFLPVTPRNIIREK